MYILSLDQQPLLEVLVVLGLPVAPEVLPAPEL
jgi:hypothetical protein